MRLEHVLRQLRALGALAPLCIFESPVPQRIVVSDAEAVVEKGRRGEQASNGKSGSQILGRSGQACRKNEHDAGDDGEMTGADAPGEAGGCTLRSHAA